MCGSGDLLSCSLKSFDMLTMSASLRIGVARSIVTVGSREGIRRSMIAMLNTCVCLTNRSLTGKRLLYPHRIKTTIYMCL
jgi:hypothetical protein